MDDELRKAAGTAVDVWDDTSTRHEDVVNAMNDLRKVLANNANAAPDDKPDHSLEQSIHAILAAQLHYPRCWDTAAYPTLYSAIDEVLSSFQCTNEDTHPVAALEQVSRDCQWQASLDDKRDAERYRFMQGNESIKFWDGLGALHPSEWDEFIDAAMKEKP